MWQAGKSLYTTIRELVENSLDAAESIGALPLVSLTVEEFTEAEFNEHRGMDNRDVVDAGLFKVPYRIYSDLCKVPAILTILSVFVVA